MDYFKEISGKGYPSGRYADCSFAQTDEYAIGMALHPNQTEES